jgi:hypothetical protein
MKAHMIAALIAALPIAAVADTYVNGYFRSDGTYVAPHYQTSPNSTRLDNYSTRGNINPYTGAAGTRNPYAAPPVRAYGQKNYMSPYPSPYGASPSSPYEIQPPALPALPRLQ